MKLDTNGDKTISKEELTKLEEVDQEEKGGLEPISVSPVEPQTA